jgi:hypothetical protein
MKIKPVAKKAGSVLLDGFCILADAQNNVRIAEIDEQMRKLQQEKDQLSARLINR